MTTLANTIRAGIEQALEKYGLPASENVIRLLMMIAAHESRGFVCCKQLNGGPALGLFQMEPNTFDFVMGYLKRKGNFPLVSRDDIAERMLIDFEFSVAVARVYLWTEPKQIPHQNHLMGLAQYASDYWNRGGDGEPREYLNDYLVHVRGEENEVS